MHACTRRRGGGGSFMPAVISVVIPTRDRAELLRDALRSLTEQTLHPDEFEVVVVDDGSADHTREVCASYARLLQLKTFHIAPSGISAAKNLGALASSAPLVFFFDDDDVADPMLLAEHVRMHQEHAEDNVAVLNWTGWRPGLAITPLMHYVTDVGKFLFDYTFMSHGALLDYTCFWGGRASCKRRMLFEHGLFNQSFTLGCEDIELAFRWSAVGFKVAYDAEARSYMNRGVTFAEFCRRSERQGRAQHHFGSVLHADVPEIQSYCDVDDAIARWDAVSGELNRQVSRVEELEILVGSATGPHLDDWSSELFDLYGRCFRAFKLKGLADSARENATDALARSG